MAKLIKQEAALVGYLSTLPPQMYYYPHVFLASPLDTSSLPPLPSRSHPAFLGPPPCAKYENSKIDSSPLYEYVPQCSPINSKVDIKPKKKIVKTPRQSTRLLTKRVNYKEYSSGDENTESNESKFSDYDYDYTDDYEERYSSLKKGRKLARRKFVDPDSTHHVYILTDDKTGKGDLKIGFKCIEA